ncbi:MAG TPA: ABC transporter substrate-binding protein [Reyranella sp.]|nr:ABC transporter substrate-binding protein [Reyranella sp.]
MKRRHLLALAGAIPFTVQAQAQTMKRVGVLVTGDPEPTWSQFRRGMSDLGYVVDRNLRYEFRAVDAPGPRLDAAAAELAQLKIDVLVAILTPAVAAARRATSTIPIAWLGADLQATGIRSLGRPEGNVTGVLSPSSTLAGKALQLFHEIKPDTRLFGLLLNPGDPFHVPLQRDVSAVAAAEKIELAVEEPRSHEEMTPAIDALAKRGVAGIMVQPSLGLDIAARLTLERKLPAISFRREFAEQGGLLSYSSDYADLSRILARQVDKMLKGIAPANIPVQQPTRFELIVNRKTAGSLGIGLSPTFLARCDEVLE